MLIRAGIQFKVDGGSSAHGWAQRIVLDGDRCFVFKQDGALAGIRNEDDTNSFDGD
jgi:hypothetical protein